MRFLLLLILLFVFNCIFAQNNFVYLQLGYNEGNFESGVELIDSLYESSSRDGKFIIYISNGTNPIKVTDRNDWIKEDEGVREWVLESNGASFYKKDELMQLSDYFVKIFDELTTDKLNIVGRCDSTWTFYFIVSESMWNNNNSNKDDFFEKLICVNQLYARNVKLRFFFYSKDSIIKEVDFKLKNNDVFEYEK